MKNEKYVYIWDYKNPDYPFQIFIGGRGTGKTFGALDGAINGEVAEKFIYMRRTGQELELTLDSDERGEGANPFKAINRETGRNVGLRKIVKNLAGVYNREYEEDGEKLKAVGTPIGYGVALNTLVSVRSLDFTDATDLIYDEFIPERHVRKLKDEGGAFLNAIETLNRNRELEGLPPLNVWLLANSNNIYNEIFITLGIVSIVEKMLRKGQKDLYIKERGLAIHLVENNKSFVEAKADTALYRLTKGTQFYDMALKNEFAYNDFSLIGYRKVTGYQPICAVDNAYIFRKKGEREYYVSYAPAKCPHFDTRTEQERRRFLQNYGLGLIPAFVAGNIIFESFELKQKILDIIL